MNSVQLALAFIGSFRSLTQKGPPIMPLRSAKATRNMTMTIMKAQKAQLDTFMHWSCTAIHLNDGAHAAGVFRASLVAQAGAGDDPRRIGRQSIKHVRPTHRLQ